MMAGVKPLVDRRTPRWSDSSTGRMEAPPMKRGEVESWSEVVVSNLGGLKMSSFVLLGTNKVLEMEAVASARTTRD